MPIFPYRLRVNRLLRIIPLTINDSHEHAAVDRLLVLIAQTLLRRTRGSDSVARIGGDEFSVLLHWVDHAAPGIGQTIQDKLHAALSDAGFESMVSVD
jgi:diguanylate cyclase (GGDEF)-like protein